MSLSRFFNIHKMQAKTLVDVTVFNLDLRQLFLFVCLYQDAVVFFTPINDEAEMAFTFSSVLFSGAAIN